MIQSNLPRGPVVRTPSSHCQGPGFKPWSGNYNPTKCVPMTKTETNNKKRMIWKTNKCVFATYRAPWLEQLLISKRSIKEWSLMCGNGNSLLS